MLLSLFFISWLGLSQVDWVDLLEIKESSDKLEQKLGDQLWEIYSREADEASNDTILHALDTLMNSICEANNINEEKIKLHVLQKDEVNAFAIPDGHLVIYTGLIKSVDKQEELAGIICHELAHIELNHVMKKLAKELGVSMLISVTTGNSVNGVAEIAKLLSSSAFDRSLEREADLQAADYLTNANIDPEHLANFLFKMSLDGGDYTEYLSWISTHPDSKERAEYIISATGNEEIENSPILADQTWQSIKNTLK